MMAKAKFELTSDLIKVEKEQSFTPDYSSKDINPSSSELNYQKKNEKQAVADLKEQINLKISKKIKKDFKMWCIKNSVNMTEALEQAILNLIKE